MVKLVKMINEAGKIADVHPNEVNNFARGGYVEHKGGKLDEMPAPPLPAQVDTGAPAINATDKAVELATDAGLDISTVVGTGRGGQVTVKDVETAIEALGESE